MDRSGIIAQLDKATDKAAAFALQRGVPALDQQTGTRIGNTVIKKNKNGSYDIFSVDKKSLFNNISVFEIATIIAQRYNSGEFKIIEKIITIENTYSNYHMNMLHYLHCMKGAKKRRDYSTMAILEDKFQISELRARRTRDSITFFKKS